MNKLLEWASLRGRANRKPYWLTLLAATGVILLCVLAMTPFLPAEGEASTPAALVAIVILALPVLCALWVLCIAVTVRRLHDRDKSAWWLLPYVVLPSLFDAIAGDDLDRMGPVILKMVAVLLALAALVDLGFLKGTTGPNRYGPDPLDTPQDTAA